MKKQKLNNLDINDLLKSSVKELLNDPNYRSSYITIYQSDDEYMLDAHLNSKTKSCELVERANQSNDGEIMISRDKL